MLRRAVCNLAGRESFAAHETLGRVQGQEEYRLTFPAPRAVPPEAATKLRDRDVVLSLMLRPREFKRRGDGGAPPTDHGNLDRPVDFHELLSPARPVQTSSLRQSLPIHGHAEDGLKSVRRHEFGRDQTGVKNTKLWPLSPRGFFLSRVLFDGHSVMSGPHSKVHTQVDRAYVISRLIRSVDGRIGIPADGSIFIEQRLVRDIEANRLRPEHPSRAIDQPKKLSLPIAQQA